MQTHMKRQNTSYARRKASSLEVNADILVAFFYVSAEGTEKFRVKGKILCKNLVNLSF